VSRESRCITLRGNIHGRFFAPMATVQTKQDLMGRLRRHRGDLRRLGVQRLSIFGSFQRDEPNPESDVDLLVDFAPGEKTLDHFMAVSFLLEEALGRPVELVTREALSPHLGPHILDDVDYVEIGIRRSSSERWRGCATG